MQGRPAWSRVSPGLLLIALPTLVALLVVAASFAEPQPEVWSHLAHHVLPGVLANTALLVVGVGSGVLVLGTAFAWLTAACDFPGRRFFAWALVLPLAMPAYVLAFVMAGLFDYSGPFATLLRDIAGAAATLPPVRSRGGALLTLTLAFYPYVYLLARIAFLTQGRRALEAAQTLGLSRAQAFWRVALPMARPWLAGGVTLALMESLADFGAVSVFNFDTFTTAIYKAWFALFNLPAAAQLASLLVAFVLLLAWAEAESRGARHFHGKGGRAARIVLSGTQRWIAAGACLAVLLVAFVVPLLQLLVWAAQAWPEEADARYVGFVLRSLALSAVTAVAVALIALLLAHLARRHGEPVNRWLARLATLGYALPGSVLAVGVFIPVAWVDRQLVALLRPLGGDAAQILGGSLAVVVVALCTRFLAVGHQPVEAAMQRITRNQEDAARSLGTSARALLWRVHLPLLRGGLLTALLLVFVETMKELPITLMTRPFGWETLAVRVFEMTSEGMWQQAALPSLAIVAAGLLPVLLLVRQTEN
jgi:iron(III) transport system permease protein